MCKQLCIPVSGAFQAEVGHRSGGSRHSHRTLECIPVACALQAEVDRRSGGRHHLASFLKEMFEIHSKSVVKKF